MRRRIAVLAMLLLVAYGCATSTTPPKTQPESLHGIASWYGEEFAGRTTANGEIFDPAQLTAAHRTLPFGTVIDVMNPKSRQSVRVRVNDRGPYIGNRVLDLSYAAAQQIGLIEPGTGEVNITIVKMGSGEREAPAPFEATIAAAPPIEVTPAPAPVARDAAPEVEIPIPKEEPVPVVVPRVVVEENGRTLKETKPEPLPVRVAPSLFVQVGAFSIEANANALLERLTSIGQKAFIARDDLYRVRLGPFASRDEAVKARASLEANGISAIIVAE